MQGANEYYDLFSGESQQIGRLFLQLHTHARGKCFEIFLLPEGVDIKGDRISGRDNVEIYGMTGGQRGWSERYGWLHTGKWQEDFYAIVKQKKAEREDSKKQHKEEIEAQDLKNKENVNGLLSTYA
jgi:hypothetical protein